MEKINKQIEVLVADLQYNAAAELLSRTLSFTCTVKFFENGFYDQYDQNNQQKRDIYKITLNRGNKKFTFKFGQSLYDSEFYAKYGVQKYPLPRNQINISDNEIAEYVKQTFNWGFGRSKSDVIVRPKAPKLYEVLACLTTFELGSKEYISVRTLFNEQEMNIFQEFQ